MPKKKKKGGLGRGLNALITVTSDTPEEQIEAPERITVEFEDDLPESTVLSQKNTSGETVASEESLRESNESEAFENQEKEASDVQTEKSPRPATMSLTERMRLQEEQKEEMDRAVAAATREKDLLSEGQLERGSGERPVVADQQATRQEQPLNPEEIPIELIFPNPDQPRTSFKKEELQELASSIETNGLLQPILVRTADNGTYQIVAGERRWQACVLLGLKTVPVRIKDVSNEVAFELALVENIQRSDLNPIEEAYGYRKLMERSGLTQAELAQKLAKGRSTIANALRLLELPEDAQQLLFEEKITAGHARAILSVASAEGRQKLTEKLVKEKMSVREAENAARLLSLASSGKKAPKNPTPKSFKMVAKSLKEALSTSVKVKTVQGKNKIEIEFKDEDDLERICKTLLKEEHKSVLQ